MDCTVEEMAFYANIHRATLYRWLEEDKEFSDRIRELRQTPFLLARKTISDAIKVNPQYAFEYMKRKARKEFGDNVDLTTKGEKVIPILGGQSQNVHNDNGDQTPITTEEKD
jgi:hypothetical protein